MMTGEAANAVRARARSAVYKIAEVSDLRIRASNQRGDRTIILLDIPRGGFWTTLRFGVLVFPAFGLEVVVVLLSGRQVMA